MPADNYSRLAPYYDLLHVALTEDIDFVLALARRHGGPVLELGCGTGRLLVPLARAGHSVVGLDNSPAMLARAQQRLVAEPEAAERVSLVVADMTRFALAPASVSLALVPYNTFMHLDAASAKLAVQGMARHLRPGGRLFLDLANPFAVEETPADRLVSLERILTVPDSGDLVVVLAASRLQPAAQLLNITWVFDVSPLDGGAVQRTVAEVGYHYYYPHQIELLLQQGSLQLEALYGDYNGGEFDDGAERLLVIARKPS